jgi:hypothetical protein
MATRTLVRLRGNVLGPLIVLSTLGCGAAGDDPGDRDAGPSVLTLGEPTAVFPEDFGTVQTVRELPGGDVLAADPLARALYRIDMDAGTREVIGSEGEGPGEYLQPDAVWPLPGDSTLLVDLGNGRLVALGPDLSFGPTMPIAMGEPSLGGGLVLALPQGVDGAGRVYAPSRGGGFGTQAPDSGAIISVDRATQAVDTVGAFKLQGQIRTVSPGSGGRGISVTQIPLSHEDGWGVARDGSAVVARAGDYHVEWLRPDGSVTRGPPIPYERVSLGRAEQEEWDVERNRSAGLSISISIGGGAAEASFQRGGRGGSRGETDFSQYEWPEVLPPFHPGRLPIDAMGRAWVRRHVGAGRAPVYDVFDQTATRVATVELGPDRRIIGFGADAVYVVRYDEFDLNYLERYGMPGV